MGHPTGEIFENLPRKVVNLLKLDEVFPVAFIIEIWSASHTTWKSFGYLELASSTARDISRTLCGQHLKTSDLGRKHLNLLL